MPAIFLRLLGQVLNIGWIVFRKIHLMARELPQELLYPQLPQLVQALLNCKRIYMLRTGTAEYTGKSYSCVQFHDQ